MKKISLLLLLAVVLAFAGCSNDDDKNDYVASFENKLTATESEYQAAGTPSSTGFQKDTFRDPEGLITFDHYYADWGFGGGYSFAGFTYMNKTDNQTVNSPAPISGKGKTSKVYIAVDSSDGEYGTPAILTINNPEQYGIKGTWITNSTYAYNCMTKGVAPARAFKKGDWYKVTATGLDSQNQEVGKVEISLAAYASDTDKPVADWIWFDLSSLHKAVSIKFIPSSSDTGQFGMNTAAYFCLDGITLTDK